MNIAPSVLTADFTKLQDELESIKDADYIHIDIMDGHFVPNISFGPTITRQIASKTGLMPDIHLMVTHPDRWIEAFSAARPAFITIHTESENVMDAARMIKGKGIGLGISIKPGTPVDALDPWLDMADLILVMTVEPGFGGQTFMPGMLDKVRTLDTLRKKTGKTFLIEVDGGVNEETITLCKDAGVDIAVVGSHLFDREDRADTIRRMQ